MTSRDKDTTAWLAPLMLLCACLAGLYWLQDRARMNHLADGAILPSTVPGFAILGVLASTLIEVAANFKRNRGRAALRIHDPASPAPAASWRYLLAVSVAAAWIPVVGLIVVCTGILAFSMAAYGMGAKKIGLITVIFMPCLYILFFHLLGLEAPHALFGG